jgi:hypothetical protein
VNGASVVSEGCGTALGLNVYYVPGARTNLISYGQLLLDGYQVETSDGGRTLEVSHVNNPNDVVIRAEFRGDRMAEVTYTSDQLGTSWLQQSIICFRARTNLRAAIPPNNNIAPPGLLGDKARMRHNEVMLLFNHLGKPSFKVLYNMVSNGAILNSIVTGKDVANHKEFIDSDPARLLATITDKVNKHSSSPVVNAIGEQVNMDIIFDDYSNPYLFLEDRYHS